MYCLYIYQARPLILNVGWGQNLRLSDLLDSKKFKVFHYNITFFGIPKKVAN